MRHQENNEVANGLDSRTCCLPLAKGGLGFKPLQPITSQIMAEAVTQDLNDPSPKGHLTRHLLAYQLKTSRIASLREGTARWLKGHKKQALALHQAARACSDGLIVDWHGGVQMVLTNEDLYDIVNTANGFLRRGASAEYLDKQIMEPLWSQGIRYMHQLHEVQKWTVLSQEPDRLCEGLAPLPRSCKVCICATDSFRPQSTWED